MSLPRFNFTQIQFSLNSEHQLVATDQVRYIQGELYSQKNQVAYLCLAVPYHSIFWGEVLLFQHTVEKYNVSECLICGPILTEENIPFLLKEGMALLLMHIITIDTSLFICKTEQVSYIPKFTKGEELNQRNNAVF